MSHFTDINGNNLLTISFPEEKFSNVLQKLNFNEPREELSFEKRRIVFLITFREFLKGNFSLDDFSEISNSIKMTFPSESKTDEQDDFEIVIYEAADLSLYLRNSLSDTEPMFVGMLQSINEFFNKYKYLLDNLPEDFSQPAPNKINADIQEILTKYLSGFNGDIILLSGKTIVLEKTSALELPKECEVIPFVFNLNNSYFAGILLDFMVSNIEKHVDPFLIEEDIERFIEKIKIESGFKNAIAYSPFMESDRTVESLPWDKGDCYLFEL